MKDEMQRNEVARLFAVYGADPQRWPAEKREVALLYMSRSGDDFNDWRKAASALDARLDSFTPVQARRELRVRLRALPDRKSNIVVFPWRRNLLQSLYGPYMRAAAGLVAAAVLGFVTGVQIPQEDDPIDSLDISAFVQGVTQSEEQL